MFIKKSAKSNRKRLWKTKFNNNGKKLMNHVVAAAAGLMLHQPSFFSTLLKKLILPPSAYNDLHYLSLWAPPRQWPPHQKIGLQCCQRGQHERGPISMVVFHQRLSSIKSRLPSKNIFLPRSSFIQGHLPSKVVLHPRLSIFKGQLILKVIFHQR